MYDIDISTYLKSEYNAQIATSSRKEINLSNLPYIDLSIEYLCLPISEPIWTIVWYTALTPLIIILVPHEIARSFTL